VNRIALLTLGLVLATPAAAVDLTLKAEATLQRDHAVLGDLLASSPDSIRSGQTLSDVVVLKRSSSGNTITLTRAMLARRLFIARPELRGTINWHGAASITIHTESAPDMDARLVDAAKVELEAYLAGQVKVFVVEPASSRTRPVLPPGEFTFRAQALADRPPPMSLSPRKIWTPSIRSPIFCLSGSAWISRRSRNPPSTRPAICADCAFDATWPRAPCY
jgi:hypothetical protein